MLSRFSRVQLFTTPCTVAHQAPLSMGFSRQDYGSELSCPSPEDLPTPGTEPKSPALRADSLLSEPPGKPSVIHELLKQFLPVSIIQTGSYKVSSLARIFWQKEKFQPEKAASDKAEFQQRNCHLIPRRNVTWRKSCPVSGEKRIWENSQESSTVNSYVLKFFKLNWVSLGNPQDLPDFFHGIYNPPNKDKFAYHDVQGLCFWPSLCKALWLSW